MSYYKKPWWKWGELIWNYKDQYLSSAHLGGEGQVKTSDTKATGRKSGTAVGPLSSSSVGMAMSFSLLQALVYALLEDF